MSIQTYTPKQIDRFWNNVKRGAVDECWPWKLSLRLDGYGQVGLLIDKRNRVLKAHKVAWEIHNNVQLGHNVRASHTCGHPACCNPHHVTIDWLPGVTSIHTTSGPRGESHGRAKLTEKQARLIKYRLNALTTREIADSFSVAFHTVWDIRKGITWRHI